MQGNGLVASAGDILLDSRVGLVDPVRLGRLGQIDGQLGQCELAFGKADEMNGLHGVDGASERVRIGQTDVLGGKTDHPPGDIEGVFPRFQHPSHPVQGRVGVAVAQGLVKSRNQIEVLLA